MSEHHADRPANRLAGETSPYLLQHARNPVDWYPWGPEALARAKAEDRPIFLSIGYSACHWCHVMERESFEDEATAKLMNERFVNIKVDREERPDLDNLYMSAVQAMTGHGGWPMSVFLTPDGMPFYGGTYYPPEDHHGLPGFPKVIYSVYRAWEDRRDDIIVAAANITEQLKETGTLPKSEGELGFTLLDDAARTLGRMFDPAHGGFGQAPKFPHAMDIRLLLRQYHRAGDDRALHIARFTLEKMARGGIRDHLGGGFARYATDERWLVPHFEKMLYDNALLSSAYLELYQVTDDPEHAAVARSTLDYILSRMTSPEGGFYATEDADSEGVEGKFYVWTSAELAEALGPDRAREFARVYDVAEGGNWEGHSILNLARPLSQTAGLLGRDEDAFLADLAADRAKLFDARERRVPPGKDTKILTAWNGLMIAPMAEASAILGDPKYAEAAARAAGFLLDHLRGADGRLLRSFKDGRARFNGYLDDYAHLIDGLTRLFEATGTPRWIEAALDLAGVLIDEFRDADGGGFFYVGRHHEALVARQADAYDNATPSGNAMAATALARLAALTSRRDFEEIARSTLAAARIILERAPAAAGQSLIALDFLLARPREYAVIAGDDPAGATDALAAIARRFDPHKVVAPAFAAPAADLARLVPLLADRPAEGGRVTTYICEGFACRAPVAGVEGLRAALDGSR